MSKGNRLFFFDRFKCICSNSGEMSMFSFCTTQALSGLWASNFFEQETSLGVKMCSERSMRSHAYRSPDSKLPFVLMPRVHIRYQAVLSGLSPKQQFPVFSLQPFSCCTDVTISDCISWFLYYLSASLNSMPTLLLRSILLIGFIYWPLTVEYDNSAFFHVPVPTTHVRTSELSFSLNSRS